jgi:hypothetical protein
MLKKNGKLCVGEKCPWSKLNESQVQYILNLWEKKKGKAGLQSSLARKFNVNLVTILDIIRGHTWKHIPGNKNIKTKRGIRGEQNHLSKLTDREVQWIKKKCKNCERGTKRRLAKHLNVSQSLIGKIANGQHR